MKQVIIIHGGDAFDSYNDYLEFLKAFEIDKNIFSKRGWKNTLQEILGSDYEVLLPVMPNKFNSKYLEWNIWFEKMIPFFASEVILVGLSLGGIFLAKYLAENAFPKQIKALFLVAAPFNNVDIYSLADFSLPESLENCAKQCSQIFLYHSEDDPVVPFSELSKYQTQLPKATVRSFKDRGHFSQESIPELVADITGCSN